MIWLTQRSRGLVFSAIIKIRARLVRSLAGGSPDDLLGYRCPFLATEPMTAPTRRSSWMLLRIRVPSQASQVVFATMTEHLHR